MKEKSDWTRYRRITQSRDTRAIKVHTHNFHMAICDEVETVDVQRIKKEKNVKTRETKIRATTRCRMSLVGMKVKMIQLTISIDSSITSYRVSWCVSRSTEFKFNWFLCRDFRINITSGNKNCFIQQLSFVVESSSVDDEESEPTQNMRHTRMTIQQFKIETYCARRQIKVSSTRETMY